MADAVRALFREQAPACRHLGSPFTARVLDILAEKLDPATTVGARMLAAMPRRDDALPLRLAGGLHALARAGRPLAQVYPPHDPSDAQLTAALTLALVSEAAALLPWLDRPPQTNEVSRSAPLIAVGHWLTTRFGLPLVLSELGCSAGLNLLWDHYALDLPDQSLGRADAVLRLTPEWRGVQPVKCAPQVADRAGVDLSPLDPLRDRDRMLAYIWADQTARLARATVALDLAARLKPEVSPGDAAQWAEGRLQDRHPRHLHLVYHTVAVQYFPPATVSGLAASLAEAGQRATLNAPLTHFAMEGDGSGPAAALTMTLWPGGHVLSFGQADFHGRWVNWQAPPP